MPHRLRRSALLYISACLMTGCAGEASKPPGRLDARAGFAGNPASPTPGEALRKAEARRIAGANEEALAILAEAHHRSPQHGGVQSAYGRLALALGYDELAEGLLEAAIVSDPGDWRALSAQGVLKWRGGKASKARGALAKAKTASADDSAVLNNLGVGYLLEGRAAQAITLLRQALASPSLNPAHAGRIRRNLAVALAVAGKFAEADALARAKLPRSLRNASPSAIRRFMHINGDPAPLRGAGWEPRLAGAGQDWPAAQ